MITSEIIKIASNTKNVGLTNNYSYKSTLKNSICGDKIKLELISSNFKINSMKYETESCIYCEASASLLANKIKNLKIKNAVWTSPECRIMIVNLVWPTGINRAVLGHKRLSLIYYSFKY